MNILLNQWETIHDTAPFSKVKNQDYLPAFTKAIADSKIEIEAIANNTELPTFENTIEAMAFSGAQLDRISSIFFNLHSAETNDEMQEIAQQVSPLLSEFSNDIRLNKNLFERVKTVYNNKSQYNLNVEQQTLLEKTYKGFSRNGANLNETDKEKLREIDKQLSKLKLTFGENVLAESNDYQLHVTNEADLAGLPEGAIEAAKELAVSQNQAGWIFTLDIPSYLPFVTYADNRDLRQQIAIAYGAKAFRANEFNNENNVLQIAKLRFNRAQLLGYASHAHFVLEERMAENPEKVSSFLNELLDKAKPAAIKEFETLQQFAKDLDGLDQLQKWDGAYYSEKLKKQLYNLDDEILKPYFQLENVLEGVFEIAGRLFDLKFSENTAIDTYHEDVKTYDVINSKGEFIAVLYTDFYPRKGKRNGAWMTSYKSQSFQNGRNHRPHISIVCNFTKPTETKPSLLTFNEVTTLFHEFGHALHGMLANTTYPSLSGTNVYWDFVELPSQIFENWCYQPEALSIFAKHYQTGEIIPQQYIQKIKESASFQEGLATMRQLSFGMLDMAWHAQDPSNIQSVKDFEVQQFAATQLYPDVLQNAMSTSFSHIFQGGYSSGYYSYKWAEVLDADAFEYFQQKGIFNPEVAQLFKDHILSKGGTEHPMTLYKRFRGQEPKPDALLKRAGLL